MQRLLALLLLIIGLGVGGWTLADSTGDDFGTVSLGDEPRPSAAATRSDPSSPTRTPPTEPGADAGPTPSPAATAPPIGRSSARASDLDLTGPPAPSQLDLPSIGVDAEVVPVGVDPDGLMTVPEDVDTVGWYRWGAAPAAEQGSVVLAGHVDDRVQGRGAFFDLRAMEVGDELTVADADGTTTTWRVTGRRTYQKASLPIDDLYRRDGPARLVLITCGGEFDRAARSYESNVVVEAELAP